ncbi:unnamed protein product [Mytilus coruscus]|uniref:Phorbol-ester/DAG-type domain-containing protein n=1 Tax=Mytilus coruscus TaxID=42192 RepID=A0A6J8EMK9_MYTCO|nr:unnamed protein product [Mytilus coruscus]
MPNFDEFVRLHDHHSRYIVQTTAEEFSFYTCNTKVCISCCSAGSICTICNDIFHSKCIDKNIETCYGCIGVNDQLSVNVPKEKPEKNHNNTTETFTTVDDKSKEAHYNNPTTVKSSISSSKTNKNNQTAIEPDNNKQETVIPKEIRQIEQKLKKKEEQLKIKEAILNENATEKTTLLDRILKAESKNIELEHTIKTLHQAIDSKIKTKEETAVMTLWISEHTTHTIIMTILIKVCIDIREAMVSDKCYSSQDKQFYTYTYGHYSTPHEPRNCAGPSNQNAYRHQESDGGSYHNVSPDCSMSNSYIGQNDVQRDYHQINYSMNASRKCAVLSNRIEIVPAQDPNNHPCYSNSIHSTDTRTKCWKTNINDRDPEKRIKTVSNGDILQSLEQSYGAWQGQSLFYTQKEQQQQHFLVEKSLIPERHKII